MDGMTGKPDIEGEYSIVSPIGMTAEDVEAAWH
jgi:hypothetical protein